MIATPDKHGLRVKSYFASSFQEAMKQAQLEMGPDALLLNSRETTPETRHLGAWEVVFGASTEPPKVAVAEVKKIPAPVPAPLPVPVPVSGPAEPPAADDDVRQHLHDIQALLKRLASGPQVPDRASNSGVVQALMDAGLDQPTAVEIEQAVQRRMGKPAARTAGRTMLSLERERELLLAETAQELSDRFTVLPEIGRITALVGAPGSGKTTALVKLATIHGLLARRPVRLITADTRRIGSVEQFRTYADILGVSFQAVENVESLARAIDGGPQDALTLIDTPGITHVPLNEQDAPLAIFLRERQDIDIHLVLTASMRSEDLKRTVDRFELFSPAKLLFTKVDETDSFASIFREASTRQKPLSFFTDGLSIPENIKPASKEQVVDALVRHLPEALRVAA